MKFRKNAHRCICGYHRSIKLRIFCDRYIRVLASLAESIPLWQWSTLIAMIGEPRQNIYATICNAVPLVGFSCSFLITPLMKGH